MTLATPSLQRDCGYRLEQAVRMAERGVGGDAEGEPAMLMWCSSSEVILTECFGSKEQGDVLIERLSRRAAVALLFSGCRDRPLIYGESISQNAVRQNHSKNRTIWVGRCDPESWKHSCCYLQHRHRG